MFMDAAGNMNSTSNLLNYTYTVVDTTAPVVMITSHMSGDDVTGSPTISGTVTDTG